MSENDIKPVWIVGMPILLDLPRGTKFFDQSAIDRLTEERDAAVADAERYRWLKAGGKPAVGYLELMSSSDGWDSAIDAAKVATE